jgi:hypothetical protein
MSSLAGDVAEAAEEVVVVTGNGTDGDVAGESDSGD